MRRPRPRTLLDRRDSRRRVEKPWGYEIHWTPTDRPYVGKVLHVDAGKRLSLQVHDAEDRVVVPDERPGQGRLGRRQRRAGRDRAAARASATRAQIGQRHRLVGITDCDILEVSTPEIGTTHRLEDDYARPDETEEYGARAPGRGWAGAT